jgi:fructose-bisphosphate aldolase class 1
MAMSYSYALQEAVYDAWQEAEAKVAAAAGNICLAARLSSGNASKMELPSVQ